MGDNGDMLVTWTGYNSGSNLATRTYVQLVKADDSRGPIVDLGASELRSVRAGSSSDVNFVVWHKQGSLGNGGGLYKQEIDDNGNKIGGSTLISATSLNSNSYPIVINPTVKTLSNGNMVVVWSHSYSGILKTQMYSPTGVKVGAILTLNIGFTTPAREEHMIAEIGTSGEYAIVAGNNTSVKMARVSNTTNTLVSGSLETLSDSASTHNSYPEIAVVNANGAYVVTWRSIYNGKWHTFVQHFNANNVKDMPQQKFEVVGGHQVPKITSSGTTGEYTIAWGSAAVTANGYDVLTQRYNEDGTTNGPLLTFTGEDPTKLDLGVNMIPVGLDGTYALTHYGYDSAQNGGDLSICVSQVDKNNNIRLDYDPGSIGDFDISTDVVSTNYYQVTYSTGTLKINGVTYDTGSQISKAVWEDANNNNAIKLIDAVGEDYDLVVKGFGPITMQSGTSIIIPTADLLINDSDGDNDPLSIVSVQDPQHGSVVLNGDGTITFTAEVDYEGDASFIYTISDGEGGTDTATVTIIVLDDGIPEPEPVTETGFSVSAVADQVTEGQPAKFTINLDNTLTADATVNVSTATGTAGSSDYTFTNQAYTISAGNTSLTVNVPTVDDSQYEGTETFSFNVAAGTNTTGSTSNTVTINDNDPAPQQCMTVSGNGLYFAPGLNVRVDHIRHALDDQRFKFKQNGSNLTNWIKPTDNQWNYLRNVSGGNTFSVEYQYDKSNNGHWQANACRAIIKSPGHGEIQCDDIVLPSWDDTIIKFTYSGNSSCLS